MNETPNVGRPPIVIALRVSGTCSAQIAARYNTSGLQLAPDAFVGFDPFLFGGDPNTGRLPATAQAAATYWRDKTLLPAVDAAYAAFPGATNRPQFLIHAIRHVGSGPYRWDAYRLESLFPWTEWWDALTEEVSGPRIPWGRIHAYMGARQGITAQAPVLPLSVVNESLSRTLRPGRVRRFLSGVVADSGGSVPAEDPILAIVQEECRISSTRLGIEGGDPRTHPADRPWWFESRRFRQPFADAPGILSACRTRGQMAVGLCWFDGRPQIALDVDTCFLHYAVPCLSWNDVLEWERSTGLTRSTIISAAAAGRLSETLSAAGSVN